MNIQRIPKNVHFHHSATHVTQIPMAGVEGMVCHRLEENVLVAPNLLSIKQILLLRVAKQEESYTAKIDFRDMKVHPTYEDGDIRVLHARWLRR